MTTGYALASRDIRTRIPTPVRSCSSPTAGNCWEEIDELPGYAQDIARAGRRSDKLQERKDPPLFLTLRYMAPDLWLAQFTDARPEPFATARAATALAAISGEPAKLTPQTAGRTRETHSTDGQDRGATGLLGEV